MTEPPPCFTHSSRRYSCTSLLNLSVYRDDDLNQKCKIWIHLSIRPVVTDFQVLFICCGLVFGFLGPPLVQFLLIYFIDTMHTILRYARFMAKGSLGITLVV